MEQTEYLRLVRDVLDTLTVQELKKCILASAERKDKLERSSFVNELREYGKTEIQNIYRCRQDAKQSTISGIRQKHLWMTGIPDTQNLFVSDSVSTKNMMTGAIRMRMNLLFKIHTVFLMILVL